MTYFDEKICFFCITWIRVGSGTFSRIQQFNLDSTRSRFKPGSVSATLIYHSFTENTKHVNLEFVFQAKNPFTSVSFVQRPVARKRIFGCTCRNFIRAKSRCSARCVISHFLTGTYILFPVRLILWLKTLFT